MKCPQKTSKTFSFLFLILLMVITTACSSSSKSTNETVPEEEPTEEPSLDTNIETLTPAQHLLRASMALRGTRPSVEELQAVQEDPATLESFVDAYLNSEAFGETIKDLHNETLLLRAQNLIFNPVDILTDYSVAFTNQSLTDAPLRLIENVVMNDRPYTEILTTDEVQVNGPVSTVWGLPYDGDGFEWQTTGWNDSRPAAGILSSSMFFVRHRSAAQNFNRGRANAVSKALLCYDFLSQDIVVDGSIDLSDPDEVKNAVKENEACASCHSTLDPLASFFFGFADNLPFAQLTEYPVEQFYRPFREDFWASSTETAPGYFGEPGDRIDDLAQMIAADTLFAQCTSRRFYSFLSQTRLEDVPFELVEWLKEEFIASNYNAKSLAKSVVLSDSFKVSHATTEDTAEDLIGYKKVRPAQLARMLYDLTGFLWTVDLSDFTVRGHSYGVAELPMDDFFGYRVLGGGIDSQLVPEPSHTYNATASLFLRSFSSNAADHVVEADFAESNLSNRKLLSQISESELDEVLIRDQLVALHLRLYGDFLESDSQEVDDAYSLFSETLSRTSDTRHAWKTVITAMLQSWKMAHY